jgi:hypothetical protein
LTEVEPAPPYEMTLSLNVLHHLGLNLYSSMPAVLSEVVANAWDADAATVTITLDIQASPLQSKIVIQDDGIGMTLGDVNQRSCSDRLLPPERTALTWWPVTSATRVACSVSSGGFAATTLPGPASAAAATAWIPLAPFETCIRVTAYLTNGGTAGGDLFCS